MNLKKTETQALPFFFAHSDAILPMMGDPLYCELAFANNVEPGTATVALMGLGNYSGEMHFPFEIFYFVSR
ncbi:hypothetical protein [Hallerella succinigenes]|uniref:hypothetical protein n=1 Tax=Hallerella succinigenes TaxID=1896222 RepID=UPI000C24904E|nr:hypothetical protein [Hallerella succinigenes]